MWEILKNGSSKMYNTLKYSKTYSKRRIHIF